MMLDTSPISFSKVDEIPQTIEFSLELRLAHELVVNRAELW